uniref:Uncharacterized protein n=1 Tax=Angiostrongylus cantonensis TaxID=6313 RepID=A0A0K0DJT4_ANGCA
MLLGYGDAVSRSESPTNRHRKSTDGMTSEDRGHVGYRHLATSVVHINEKPGNGMKQNTLLHEKNMLNHDLKLQFTTAEKNLGNRKYGTGVPE